MSLLDKARERLFAKTSGEPVQMERADDQSQEDKAVVGFVRSKLDQVRSSSARVAQEGINLTNIAYLCGFDNIYFDGTSKQFKPMPSPSAFIRRNRVHVNRILPTVQNRLARLLKNAPRWDVRPRSSDEDDKDAARLAEQVLIQLWDQLKINQKRIPLTMWMQQCGSAYFKISWDDTLGNKKPYAETNMETGKIEYHVEAEGDIRVDTCSYFEIFPDPMAKNWEELQYLIQAKIRPIEYFPQRYPERGKLVKEEDCWLNSLQYESRINSINTFSGTAGSGANQLKNSAIEISYYEKPSNKHPYGRHLITANGVKLKDDVLPIDELPFMKLDDIVVGGKFNAESIITHLRPLQDQINKGKSMRAAWLNRLLTGKLLAARGHNIAAEAFNDQSGEMVMYDPVPNATDPHFMDPAAIPQYAYQEEDTLKEDMNDTAGVNEVSRGQMPSSGMPAIGMQLLVEQDDTRVGVEAESHEYSYADLGRILLKFVDKFYVTDRLLKMVGEDMEYSVRKFKGDDLKENFDVHVIRGSTLPGSKTLKRQEIMTLHQGGYFGNPQDPNVVQNVLSMLEYGDEYQSWKRHSLRMAQIQRGIQKIEMLSEKPAVSEYDDHTLWIQQLDDYRISEKFMKLDDEQKQMIMDLMAEHTDWIVQITGQDADLDDPNLQQTDAALENQEKLETEGGGMPPADSIQPETPEQPAPDGMEGM